MRLSARGTTRPQDVTLAATAQIRLSLSEGSRPQRRIGAARDELLPGRAPLLAVGVGHFLVHPDRNLWTARPASRCHERIDIARLA